VSYVTDSFDGKIVNRLQQGGVGLLPSDTIYGLSCRALDEVAVKKIHRLKDRDSHKPFIILISDIKMLDLLSISQDQAKIANDYWPGALSVIFSSPGIPTWLQLGTSSLAVRLPRYPGLTKLINEVGPIVSTSANLQGEEPVKSVTEAQAIFGSQLDFYVDVGQLDNPPSTLAIAKDGTLEIIRQGAVKIN
jgi:L-threonylcarbamoyladenylate synthase